MTDEKNEKGFIRSNVGFIGLVGLYLVLLFPDKQIGLAVIWENVKTLTQNISPGLRSLLRLSP